MDLEAPKTTYLVKKILDESTSRIRKKLASSANDFVSYLLAIMPELRGMRLLSCEGKGKPSFYPVAEFLVPD